MGLLMLVAAYALYGAGGLLIMVALIALYYGIPQTLIRQHRIRKRHRW